MKKIRTAAAKKIEKKCESKTDDRAGSERPMELAVRAG
jgi:hypothetical protein